MKYNVCWLLHCFQHEAKMKTVAESMKELEAKKCHLQEQVDQLTEDCARLKAQGTAGSHAAIVEPVERLRDLTSRLPVSRSPGG